MILGQVRGSLVEVVGISGGKVRGWDKIPWIIADLFFRRSKKGDIKYYDFGFTFLYFKQIYLLNF